MIDCFVHDNEIYTSEEWHTNNIFQMYCSHALKEFFDIELRNSDRWMPNARFRTSQCSFGNIEEFKKTNPELFI